MAPPDAKHLARRIVSVASYWEAITSGRKRGPAAAAARAGLRVASGGYWLALEANLGVYRLGFCRHARVPRPVVVVGNLTVGGTGKTTATIYLVRRLANAGLQAGVILRGHRRRSGGPPELLVSDGTGVLAFPPEAGDEAVLLARALPGHPVAVGVRRERVARLLLDRAPADALVLDDGFQYFRLARDADVVLVDATHEIERDHLLPAGKLREPPHHLRRATQVWITHSELAAPQRIEQLREWIEGQAPGRPVVVTEHRPTGLRPLSEGEPPSPGDKVAALSGLGNPRSFEAGLARLGYEVVAARFADHHRYEPRDWERAGEVAAKANARHIVTTEKDAVKLSPPPAGLPPVWVLGCELAVVSGGEAVDRLVRSVVEREEDSQRYWRLLAPLKGGRPSQTDRVALQAHRIMRPRPKHPLRRSLERALTRGITGVFYALMRVLPLRWGRRLGHHIGRLVVVFCPRRVKLAMRNLEAAFGDRFTPAERRRIVINVARNMSKVFVELFKMPSLTDEQLKHLVRVEGVEVIEKALARRKGVVLITAHYGNWELAGARGAAEGFPMAVIARDASDAGVAAIINRSRESKGLKVFGRRDLRGMIRHLGHNGCLCILPDQSAKTESVRMTFFGRPAWVTRGPAILALRTGAALIPVFSARDEKDDLSVYVLPEIEVDSSPDREQAILATMEKVNRVLEAEISRRPDHWLWFHDRWKEYK